MSRPPASVQPHLRFVYNTTARIDDHVHIGGYLAAADPELVRRQGFTHILKLFPDDAGYPGGYHRHPGVEYLVIAAEDAPEYPLDRHFAGCLAFIQGAIRSRGVVLVHCHAGVSRSASIVLLHLMINSGLPLTEAWSHLQAVRPFVRPNPGFWKLLEAVHKRASLFRREGLAPARPSLFQQPGPPPSPALP
jgi:predicted protein tyrosine phosphatase